MNTLEHIVINTSEISLTMSCEDIYEALRFCAIEKKCTRCPLFSITDCDAVLMPAVFEMVKRQKSEIETLKKEIENLESTQEISPEAKHFVDTKADKVISLLNKAIKSQEQIEAEAIKVFTEKTDKIITEIYNKFIFGYALGDEAREAIMDFYVDISRGIDNLVKEMMEEKE